MNLYLQTLYESALAATIIPFTSNATFAAMLGFGGYNLWLAGTCVLLGAAGGYAFNWWLGTRLIPLQQKNKLGMSPSLYASSQLALSRYLFWLLCFASLPMMNFLVLAAGFFGISARKTLLLSMAGHTAFLIWVILKRNI